VCTSLSPRDSPGPVTCEASSGVAVIINYYDRYLNHDGNAIQVALHSKFWQQHNNFDCYPVSRFKSQPTSAALFYFFPSHKEAPRYPMFIMSILDASSPPFPCPKSNPSPSPFLPRQLTSTPPSPPSSDPSATYPVQMPPYLHTKRERNPSRRSLGAAVVPG
jgi:hypothetical protein